MGDQSSEKTMARSAHLKELTETFHLFDKDGDGRITAEELQSVLTANGFKPSQKDIDKAMREGDQDGNHTIEFDEFIAMMETKLDHQNKYDELVDSFSVFDRDKNGLIDASELKCAMSKLGYDLTNDEVATMIKEADLDGNGKIDFDEYYQYMMKK